MYQKYCNIPLVCFHKNLYLVAQYGGLFLIVILALFKDSDADTGTNISLAPDVTSSLGNKTDVYLPIHQDRLYQTQNFYWFSKIDLNFLY